MLNRRLVAALGAALTLVLAGVLTLALTAGDDRAPAPSAAVRAAFHPAAMPDGVRARRARFAHTLGRDGVVESDRRTGGVRFAGRLDGFLTGPRRGDAADIALGYVAGHRRVFGLGRRDLAHLRLADRSRSHGMTLLRWNQEIGGIPLLEGSLRAAVTDDGRIVNITGGARPGLGRPAKPRLDAAAAKRAAARATGGTPRGATAALVQTAATGRVRLAWRVTRPQGRAHYDQLIDAVTGEEISRRDRVDRAVPGLVYETYPGAPVSGGQTAIDLQPYLSPGANELIGPRGQVYADPNGDDKVDLGEHIFKDGQGSFRYTRTSWTDSAACPRAVGCAWSPTFANSYTKNLKQAGAQLFALMGRFADHLAAPPIGFDGFKDELTPGTSDPVIGNVMDGAAGDGGVPKEGYLNNAGMMVLPEGQSPRIQAFLFFERDKYPALDPVDDASVIYHEYSHGLIGRTVVDAAGWGATEQRQSWALNEALADFFALDYVVGRNLIADTAAPGEVRLGAHLYDPGEGRKQPIDCPVATLHSNCMLDNAPGGLTYADYGNVHEFPEPHYDGEILAQAMWQLRGALLAAYGQGGGENRIRSLAYTALQLSPPEPSFLDYRNALLQADRVLRQGEDAERIWQVFAERKMGWYASTIDADDVDPHADDRPGPVGIPQGAVTGLVTDRDTGAPLAGAKVALGGHTTANASDPGPYDATTDADGRYTFAHVPAGTYAHLIAKRTGYATQVLEDVEVQGETRADAGLRRNWADTRAGAAIAGTDARRFDGCPPEKLADGRQTTGFGTLLDGADERYVDIALPSAQRVTSFAVDPTPHTDTSAEPPGRCGMNRTAARPTRVRIEVASEPGGPFRPAVASELDDSHKYRLTELRPGAPLDDVRIVRVHMIHPFDGREGQLAFAEVQVYATAKRPPRAVFEYAPKPLDVAQTATFDAGASTAGDAAIARYEWDLDANGSYETDTGPAPTATHAYSETGRYRVGLRVTDAAGERDEFSALVLVARDVEIFDLGTTAPDDSGAARALGISPRGAVAVSLGEATDQMPGRYEGGSVRPLDLPAGMVFGNTWAVNDSGQTVGPVYPAHAFGTVHAVMWNGSAPTMLGTLGGSSAIPVGLNANGWTVGWSYDSKSLPRGFLKRPGNPMVDVQEEAGVPVAQRRTMKLVKINDAGVAVGCSGYQRAGEGCDDAVVYNGVTRTLTWLPDLGFSAGASGVSQDGRTVTGRVYDADSVGRAALWHDGVLKVLGLLGGDSTAMALNAQGTVVGAYGDLTGTDAFLWRDGEGATMLDTLVPDTGWHLMEANGITDREEIVGKGTIGGVPHAYQLNLGPCRVCVTDVQLEERDLPGSTWKGVGSDGTVEGNRVRVLAQVANHDDQPHVFQVKARDETRKKNLDGQPPTVSLDPGEEEWVELNWDTDGLAWKDGAPDADHILRVRAVLGHTIFGGRSTVLKVRPRPVVLVPGALEDASVWKDYAELLHRANSDWEARPVAGLDTGSWSDLGRSLETMGRHAEVLAATVAGVRGAEDAEHVDVVAHGLGGLIARQYVQDRMGEAADGRPVALHLVQLGAPNLGTPCAELLDTDAMYDLRRDVVTSFNARVSDRKGVRFSAYAGDVAPSTCVPGSERGDTAVPLSSARWTIADSRTGDVDHATMPASGSLFTDFVKPRLVGEHDTAAPAALRAAAADEPPAASPRSHQLLAQRIVTVAPGGDGVLVPLDVDGGSRLDVTVLAPPEVKAVLTKPDGTVAATADSGLTRELAADDPEPGRWLVRLRSTATATATAPVQVAVAATERDDPWSVDLLRGRPAAGGGVPLLAAVTRFDRRVADAAVTLEVERRGGAPVPVTLLDDGAHGDGLPGDGCYGAEPKLDAGEALLRLRVRRGDGERVRLAWADIPEAAGEGRRPTCPDLRGRNGEIAFNSEIWSGDQKDLWATVDPEGAIGSLPFRTRRASEARWSADGTRLAWTEGDELFVANGDGTQPVKVAGGDDVHRDAVEWSRDGTRLAYARRCGGGPVSSTHLECEVMVLDLASGQERKVANGAAPSWSPDGEQLVIVRGNTTARLATDLYTLRLEDGRLDRITTLGGGIDEPMWSPRGDRIVFSRYDSFSAETETGVDQEIYAVDPDGGAVRNLTNDKDCDSGCRPDRRDRAPSWSPDGRRIAFISTRGEPIDARDQAPHSAQVWEMRWDGSGLRKRTTTATYKWETAWRAVPFLDGDAAPRCFDLDAQTLTDKVVRIPLDCTDDNGDRLALRVTAPPAHGTLGPIDDGDAVRYTPAAGYVGADAFSYAASDATSSSAPATVRVTVAAPPPPPPPPPPPEIIVGGGGGSGGGGGGGGGGGHHGGDGGVITIPGDCVVDPRTGYCIVVIGCQPGGDISGCTGRLAEVPPRGRRSAIAASARARTKLLKPVTLRIPAGQTRKVRLKLTRAGLAQLTRKRKLAIRVAIEVRAGATVSKTTRRVVFRTARRRVSG